ncbi:MAG: ABC transporter permease [Lachnospiraceae bacterium]|nr:ABC transporter permease [Lachnospiraceae bacterium]
MYVIKNAIKSIFRSKGRNVLIGIIVLAISVSACLGLSIRQAASKAKDDALDNMTITAQISFDRNSIMNDMRPDSSGSGGFDKSKFSESMKNMQGLSVDEMLTYADNDNVKDFYYTLTVSMNGSEEFEAVDTSEETDETESNDNGFSDEFGDMSGMMKPGKGFTIGSMGSQGDFTVIGYSTDSAMTDFINGTSSITDGNMFEEGADSLDCVISEELAVYNDLSVGDIIKVTNPNDEEETYELTIVGIYANSQSTVTSGDRMFGFSLSSDPANQIYLSYNALKSITTKSEENATISTDENTGMETTTAMPEQVSGTYVFVTVDEYNDFTTEVYDMGLTEEYVVSSSDISEYEQSVIPLDNLSEMALYFLIVVLAIGAIVLVVLNVFSVRERKYEVGVLTAIGMKKWKVSIQFMLETMVVTVIAVTIGGIIGATTSVPVTNSLLKSQIEAADSKESGMEQSFGRVPGNMMGNMSDNMPQMNFDKGDSGFRGKATEYISEVSSATDITVLMQLLGIGVFLALVASVASIVFVMRYDPLKILSNRD